MAPESVGFSEDTSSPAPTPQPEGTSVASIAAQRGVACWISLSEFQPLELKDVAPPGNLVQIQSSWFPLYDRNPQTYVPNIFFAKDADYVKATQTVFRSGDQASAVLLAVISK